MSQHLASVQYQPMEDATLEATHLYVASLPREVMIRPCGCGSLKSNILTGEKEIAEPIYKVVMAETPSGVLFPGTGNCAEGSTRWPSAQYFRSIIQRNYQQQLTITFVEVNAYYSAANVALQAATLQ